MKSSAAWYWLILLAVLGAMYGSYELFRRYLPQREPDLHITADLVPTKVTPRKVVFSLTDQHGETFRSEQLQGRVWVASYFFTACPHICLQMNNVLAGLLDAHAQEDLGLLSLTCDPENDTPEMLARYANSQGFDKYPQRWRFLTGTLDELTRVGKESFNLTVDRGTHSQRVVVVDRQGMARESFLVLDEHDLARLKTRIKELLAQPGQPAGEVPTDDTPGGDGPAAAPQEATAAAP